MTKLNAPDELSAAGKKLWREIATEIELDRAAVLLLTTLCQQHDRMSEARALLAKDGLITRDRFGQEKAHPAVQIEANAIAAMTRCWRLLGLDLVPPAPLGRPAGT